MTAALYRSTKHVVVADQCVYSDSASCLYESVAVDCIQRGSSRTLYGTIAGQAAADYDTVRVQRSSRERTALHEAIAVDVRTYHNTVRIDCTSGHGTNCLHEAIAVDVRTYYDAVAVHCCCSNRTNCLHEAIAVDVVECSVTCALYDAVAGYVAA